MITRRDEKNPRKGVKVTLNDEFKGLAWQSISFKFQVWVHEYIGVDFQLHLNVTIRICYQIGFEFFKEGHTHTNGDRQHKDIFNRSLACLFKVLS